MDKLYKEALILTSNRRKYNIDDISKINRLLQIINKIESRPIRRFNIVSEVIAKLKDVLFNKYHQHPNLTLHNSK